LHLTLEKRPTETVFYRSARTEQNKSIKVLSAKPHRNEHIQNI
jgi:hypothetical protein